LNIFWKPLPLLAMQAMAHPFNRLIKRRRASDVPLSLTAMRSAISDQLKAWRA
jgi:hypothetical protein